METTAHDTGPDSEDAETPEQAAERLLATFGKGEEAHANSLVQMLLNPECAKYFGREYSWPPIESVRKKVRVGRWEIDILVTHIDGSKTVIEVKDAAPISQVLAGIGQGLHYAVILMLMEKVLKVRVALAVGDKGCLATALTCDQAGVDYIPLGTDEEARTCMIQAARRVLKK